MILHEENIKAHHTTWQKISDHPHRILINY